MIVLIGESASGKSTIEKELIKNFKYEKVITFTTRPIRDGEQNGKDYWFVSENEFNSLKDRQYFIETAEYNGWQYGSPIIKDPKDKVIIVTPKGLRALQRTYNKKDGSVGTSYQAKEWEYSTHNDKLPPIPEAKQNEDDGDVIVIDSEELPF